MRTLFIYGTLLPGEANAARLGASRSRGTARTRPRYTLLHLGNFPALVDRGETAIVGELFDVDDTTLAGLDEFEEVPHLYRRLPVALAADGPAEAYFLSSLADWPIIACGDWRRRGAGPLLAPAGPSPLPMARPSDWRTRGLP